MRALIRRSVCAATVAVLSGLTQAAAIGQDEAAIIAHRAAVLPLSGFVPLRSEVARLLAGSGVATLDFGLADAASRGVGFNGSLNPTKDEIRRVASAIGCDILVLGTSSVAERESTDPARRWDAFAGLFLVDGRSGNLLHYNGLRYFGSERADVERLLLDAVAVEVKSWSKRIRLLDRVIDERPEIGSPESFLDFVSNPEGSPNEIPPRFFSRPVPAYTTDADRIHATATVELLVEFLADETYGRIELVRWAGFGLDESAIAAVRASKFWPARKNGRLVPARAMLRFNFRFRDDTSIGSRRGEMESAPILTACAASHSTDSGRAESSPIIPGSDLKY